MTYDQIFTTKEFTTGDKFLDHCLSVAPVLEWVKFKGEDCVACLNFEASVRSKMPMVDVFYCMTTALNGCVLNTVRFDKRFTKSLIK